MCTRIISKNGYGVILQWQNNTIFCLSGRTRYEKSQNLSSAGTAGASGGGPGAGGGPAGAGPVHRRPHPPAPGPGGSPAPRGTVPIAPDASGPAGRTGHPPGAGHPRGAPGAGTAGYPGSARPAGHPQDPDTPPEDPGQDPDPDAPPKDDGPRDDTPGGTDPTPGPSDDASPRIVTDLCSGEITYDQLTDDTLHFYAYILNANGQTLKVKLRNSQTSQNGQYLTADGRNYQARLCRGETNYFTLYRKDGNKTVQEVNYAIRYAAQKADERHPTIGDHPPTIVTNLEGVTETTNRNFTLTVQATAYTGRSLPESNIQVYLDGKRVLQPTGNPVFEYQLRFPDPFSGDSEAHTISIRAWDGQGNSRYVSYRIIYRFVDTGDVIGTAYVVLDITTMGMGLPEEPFAVQVRQNVPASYAVMEALEEWGYEYEYSGSPDVGFYLRRISRAGFMDYPDIPENLWAKILRDGLNLTGQHDNDSLGEFDYTQGSGWMYSIGGQTYAGKGLSNYFLSSGDTLYLRFTLAYGKDIGGYDATGGNYGALSTYCGRWINGQYIDEHRWGQPQQTTAPDCTHPGQAAVTCQVCGDVGRTQEIPALGHDFQETERRDGVIIYTCSRCGERKEEPIP